MGSPSEPKNSPIRFAISTVRVPANPAEIESNCGATELAPEAAEDLLEECWEQIDSSNQSPNPLAAPLQRHLQRARHVYRLESNATPFPSTEWADWAWSVNALWWIPESDGEPALLRDPAGRQLHGPGSFDAEAQIPFLPESRQRRLDSETAIRNRNLDPVDGTAPLPSSSETETFAPAIAAKRMLGLFAVAARAEAMANGQTLDLDRVRERSPLAADALTPAEKDFFDFVSPPAEMVDTAAWRYESLHTLQWALQMQPELDWPDERCDLASVLRLILSLPHEDLIGHAILRPVEELLRAADLHVCLWWKLAVEGAAGRDIPGELDPGVVAERVHALSWLLQLSGGVPEEAADMSWDQIGREIERGIVG
ncbi:DUF4272 domain-containing protein [Rhodopirellula bahusiensis]|uniref:DUF4272 domain-containing protein n=1 Tax=Rhodopirellula bahusiensis TaxID=2014065 RepID=A0A2G1WAD6_9BACT|nr:DUF4272 domain-containing protein [Rhodopirellula bahusiensis]PHQ35976.1 hypothetical protein CEE69_07180 [Rhodopirellula bahusiensis]